MLSTSYYYYDSAKDTVTISPVPLDKMEISQQLANKLIRDKNARFKSSKNRD